MPRPYIPQRSRGAAVVSTTDCERSELSESRPPTHRRASRGAMMRGMAAKHCAAAEGYARSLGWYVRPHLVHIDFISLSN